MKIQISGLFLVSMFFYGISSASFEEKIRGIRFFFEQALDRENRYIGAKLGYTGAACKAYQEYMQAAYNYEKKEADAAWQRFQKYSYEIKQTPTPFVTQLFYGGVGYWLYNRVAYPVGKKNWGMVKKTGVKMIIPAWLCKKILLSDIDLDKKRSHEIQELKQALIGLQNKNNALEAENTVLKKEKESCLIDFSSACDKNKMEAISENDLEMISEEQEEADLLDNNKTLAERLDLELDKKVLEVHDLVAPNSAANLLVELDAKKDEIGTDKQEQISWWKKKLGLYKVKTH